MTQTTPVAARRACRAAPLPRLLPAALLLAALSAAGLPLPALAQGYGSLAAGRAVFDEAGCNACHSYVSRRAAPSIRDLMRDFAGDPLAVAAATRDSAAHRNDARFPQVAEPALRSISQWLAGIGWPEDEAVAETAPPAAPVALAAAAEAIAAERALVAPVAAPVVERLVSTAPVALAAIRIEKGKPRSDRLIIELAGGEPEMVDMQMVGEQLVVSLSGVHLGEGVPARRSDWPGSHVVAGVTADDRGGSVELAIDARVARWTYTGTQSRRGLVIDLTAAAVQPPPRPAAAAVARAEPKAAKAAAPAAPKAASAPKPVGTPVAAAATAASATASAAAVPAATTTATATIATATPASAVTTQPATDAARAPEAPTQLALARPSAEAPPAAAPRAPAKARGAGKQYRDGSDLDPCPPARPEDQVIGAFDPDQVKEIMDRVGCPQCHAYVQKKTGPPFRDVIRKYKGDPACVIHRLKTNETHKDEGVTRDIAASEFKLIADYVATRIK
jgi:cytochrome c551/c552